MSVKLMVRYISNFGTEHIGLTSPQFTLIEGLPL